jgi:hypothetical protein
MDGHFPHHHGDAHSQQSYYQRAFHRPVYRRFVNNPLFESEQAALESLRYKNAVSDYAREASISLNASYHYEPRGRDHIESQRHHQQEFGFEGSLDSRVLFHGHAQPPRHNAFTLENRGHVRELDDFYKHKIRTHNPPIGSAPVVLRKKSVATITPAEKIPKGDLALSDESSSCESPQSESRADGFDPTPAEAAERICHQPIFGLENVNKRIFVLSALCGELVTNDIGLGPDKPEFITSMRESNKETDELPSLAIELRRQDESSPGTFNQKILQKEGAECEHEEKEAKTATHPKRKAKSQQKDVKANKSLKKKKDAEADRCKTAYMLFFTDSEQRLKAEIGSDYSFVDHAKSIEDMWSHLDESERASWEDKAKLDRMSTGQDKDTVKIGNSIGKNKRTHGTKESQKKVKKTKVAKKPSKAKTSASTDGKENKPKRPMSAFFHFAAEHRKHVAKANPGMSSGDISKALSEMWKGADPAVRNMHFEWRRVQLEKFQSERDQGISVTS